MLHTPESLHEVPFLRLFIPLATGIIIEDSFSISGGTFHPFLFVLLTLILLLIGSWLAENWRFRWVYGFALNIFLLYTGCVLVYINRPNQTLHVDEPLQMVIRLADEPVISSQSIKSSASVIHLLSSGTLSEDVPVLVYFSASDSLVHTLSYGDLIAVRAKPKRFTPPPNPFQFDMKRYMQLQGIEYSVSVGEGSWLKVGSQPKTIFKMAYAIRNWVIGTFKKNGIRNDELAVVSALLIGYKSLLDDELRQVYSSVGAMHILAVSGLHVGLIFGLIAVLLSALPKSRGWRILRVLLALFLLWCYAVITGLSPSVIRATFMFSLFIVGQMAGLRTNTFNTLGAAAFLLLVVNPNNLFNLGFQLSFAAVLSILLFYHPIFSLLVIRNKILGYIWALVAVSVAAQFLTLPISLYNFGQFPALFLVTNLLAIPLATLILYLAVIALSLSWVKPVAFVLFKFLGWLISLLNKGLSIIQTIPFSSITNIYFDKWQVLFLSLFLLFLLIYIAQRKSSQLHAAMVCIIAIFGLSALHQVEIKKTNEIAVLSLPRSSILCINQFGEPVFFAVDTIEQKTMKFGTQSYLRNRSIANPVEIQLGSSPYIGTPQGFKLYVKSGLALIIYSNKMIALPYSYSVRNLKSDKRLGVDILILNKYSSSQLLELIKPKVTVIDPGFSIRQANRVAPKMVMEECIVHNIRNQGAYVLSWKP